MRTLLGFSILVAVTSPGFYLPTQERFVSPGKDIADDILCDENLLREAHIPVDGPGLLRLLDSLVPKKADPIQIGKLIKDLADDKFAVREKAQTDLVALGATALPALKEAASSSELEVRQRASALYDRVHMLTSSPRLAAAAIRLVGHRKPAGAAAALLAYLPCAFETNHDELAVALGKVTVRDGKAEAAVLAALEHESGLVRGVAGAALASAKDAAHLPRARALLKDPTPEVRLRVACALIENVREKEAVPVLIHCLLEVPAQKTGQAEQVLHCLARAQAPSVIFGTNEVSRKKCFQAWNEWWGTNQAGIDLAQADFSERVLNYTLVVYKKADKGKSGSVVAEFDAAKNLRWKFERPGPCDAQVIGHERVTVLDRLVNYSLERLSQRDFQGQPLWQTRIRAGDLRSLQCLLGGNTLVVRGGLFEEFDSEGQEIVSHRSTKPGSTAVSAGLKLQNGDYVAVSRAKEITWYDGKSFQPIKTITATEPNGAGHATIQELANGNLLLTNHARKWIWELDGAGKKVWSMPIAALSAYRLPNGNTIVALRSSNKVVEYDRNWREVWSLVVEGEVLMAHKR